jgi:preprotein translocase subunit SecA
MVYNVEVTVEADELQPNQAADGGATLEYSGGTLEEGGYYGEEGVVADEDGEPVVAQRRLDENEQLGRNDPCWCGSGKKFKKCHGA